MTEKKLTSSFMRKHLTEINKQLRKQTIKDIWKSKKAKITELFNKHLDKFSGGYRPIKDLDKLLEGKKWDFDKFKKLSKPKEEKKPPPKPKPKPKPKPNKNLDISESTKSIIDKVLGSKKEIKEFSGFFQVLINKSSKETQDPVLFINWGRSMNLLLAVMMSEVKNDCGFFNTNKDVGIDGAAIEFTKFNKLSDSDISDLINQIEKCKKQGKIVVILLSLPRHMNLLIFNYHRNEVERYEPWGNESPSKSVDKRMSVFVRRFNKIKKNKANHTLNKEWKYVNLEASCPRLKSNDFQKRFTGLQSYFNLASTRTKGKLVNSKTTSKDKITIVRKDPAGWCVAYSVLYGYLRMKFPNPPAAEIKRKITDITRKLDKQSKAVLTLLRQIAVKQENEIRRLIRIAIPDTGKTEDINNIKTIQALFLKKQFQPKAKIKSWGLELKKYIGIDGFDRLPEDLKSFPKIQKRYREEEAKVVRRVFQS